MSESMLVKAARREMVLAAYNSAKTENNLRFLEGDVKGTKEYIFDNQIIDANEIVREFYENNRRVISISKKTKVGMDGLMIEIAKLMTTHPDDEFVINPANVRIITGMSNAGWEKDMKDKCPNCFKDKIFHHDQLKKADLNGLRDSLIIIDEIDTGDKEFQVLHTTLTDAGLLDVTFMTENNIRFVFASATMIKELYALYRWGQLHQLYTMTIPANYVGHSDFLARDIIKEFYPLDTLEMANKWIKEDIIENYGDDYRVHIVRVTSSTVNFVQSACIRNKVIFHNHTSKKEERLNDDEIRKLFIKPLTKHIVLAIKGFFRRANLIPNQWKLRIGATHELYTKKVDNSVQNQGLPGRMTGYWREIIEAGHKTGPYRTSINAIREYEQIFSDPFGNNSYTSAGFTKKEGAVTTAEPLMLSAKNIIGLVPVDMPVAEIDPATIPTTVPIVIQITPEEYSTIQKKAGKWDMETIMRLIKNYDADLENTLQTLEKIEVHQPNSENTYNKHITRPVLANSTNTRLDFHRKEKKMVDQYSIFLDKDLNEINNFNRIIVIIYWGSRNI